MSTIITAYSTRAFKRFLLPPVNNADHTIFLADSLFIISSSVELLLENKENRWYFTETEQYEISDLSGNTIQYDNPVIEDTDDNKEFKLMLNGEHVLSLTVQNTNTCFVMYDHFDVSGIDKPITIGRDAKNAISFDYHDKHLLSTEHAALVRMNDHMIFQDFNSANGSFVNNRRIEGSVELLFGDCVDIFGLRIVYLGNEIAINAAECGAVIDSNVLHRTNVSAPDLVKPNKNRLSVVFHRSPRRLNRLESDEFKIDDPPAPRDEARKIGFFAAVGSGLAMALPMLLGCSFMIFASRMSGFNRGLFMYVGLVTAVSSALIGTIRSIVGMRRAVKEYKQYETLRSEKYGAYLKEQEEILASKYDRNFKILNERYLSAKEYCMYDSNNPLLWNRNSSQADFLSHRLGIGDIPFQMDIVIPDQKFSMTDNSLLQIPGDIKKTYSKLRNVPVSVDLLEHPLVGIIGGRMLTGGIQVLRNLLIQISANNSYTDVKIALIYNKNREGLDHEWDFVRWLPHVWNETKTFRYIASDKDAASNVFYELHKIIRMRIDEKETHTSDEKAAIAKPYYIVIIAEPEFLNGELITQYLLDPEADYGMSTLYMTERYEQLPNKCDYIIENDEEFQGMYEVSDDVEDRIAIRFDDATSEDAMTLASKIARVEVQELETGGDIPGTISFFEMYGARKLEDFDVLTRWRKNRTYESMKAMVGQKAGGVPCYLDIHEKYHGPHGLVAGTTGSGKSETLQTYILSLAINYSPDDVGFFIIDYKGGGMANLFTDLPHMIGQISNLSGNQINRALLSIQSEKDRREALFANYGVKDIREYTKLYKNNEATVPLPHIIIVIDEFAEMKKEEPEFIQEIVSVSRVGRSLGIHLIMATQKPAGSVSDDIWANSRFKLCLRVQSKQDSTDMLHKPDAAYLTQSGRCYLQVGNDELYELFQSGYSGAIYYDDEKDINTDIAKMLTIDGVPSIEGNHARLIRQKTKKVIWINQFVSQIRKICGEDPSPFSTMSREQKEYVARRVFKNLENTEIDYPFTEHNKENLITLLEEIGESGYDAEKIVDSEESYTNAIKKLPQQPERTQLEAVVGYLKEIAVRNGYTHDFSLFMPLLPEYITLDELPESVLPWNRNTTFDGSKWPVHSGQWKVETGVGFYDDPENQRQDLYTVNFAKTGNILLFGAPNTGKTTFLQTLCYGLINRYSPAEVNLYFLEFSAHKFTVFEQAPHVGGIIRDNDNTERVDKFFMMITRMLDERKRLLGDIGFTEYLSIHGIDSVPAVFIILDGFNSFTTRMGDKYHGLIGQIAKEGINNGIYIIISAGGIGGGDISNNMAQNFRSTICLELNNAYDYSTYMRTTRLKLRPESGVRGRGVGFVGERVLEFQTAVPLKAENDAVMGDMIAELSGKMREAWHDKPARVIPEIPEEPVWSEFRELHETRNMLADDRMLPVGYNATTADVTGIDLSEFYTVLLTGSKKKGKTNALKVFMHSAHEKGSEIVIVDFDKQFTSIAAELGATHITGEAAWGQYLSDFLKNDVVLRNRRKGELRDSGAEDIDIYKGMLSFSRICIFIDDLPNFIDHINHPTEKDVPKNIKDNMELLLNRGVLHNIFWFVTIDKEKAGKMSSSGLYPLFIRDKKGLHFGGSAHATSVAGMSFENHDRRSVDVLRPAGRAMVPADNESTDLEIVLPIVKGKQT